MLKTVYLSSFLLTLTLTTFCQDTYRDSISKVAQVEAKASSTSHYFKPTEVNHKNRSLLADSVYVEAFRKAAFNKPKHHRTPWHYVLIGGSTLAIGYLGLATYIIASMH